MDQQTLPVRNRQNLENIENDLSGRYYLTQNIDLLGSDWDPLGSFTGSFDGRGHKLSNLSISAALTPAGLFQKLQNAHVHDLTIEINAAIETTGTDGAGALAGEIENNTTIENVHIRGTGYITATAGNTGLGGLVGYVLSSSPPSSIDRSSVGADITISTSSANRPTGGLVGNNYGHISNSYSKATVDGTSVVGGLVGFLNGGSVNNSYATGEVKIPSGSTATDVGELIGIVYTPQR